MTSETAERIARKIMDLQVRFPNGDSWTVASMATAELKEKVTEDDVVRVWAEARAEKMRGRE